MVKGEGGGERRRVVSTPSQGIFRRPSTSSSQPSQRGAEALPPRHVAPSQRSLSQHSSQIRTPSQRPLSQPSSEIRASQTSQIRDEERSSQNDLSGEETQKLVAEVVRHMLFKNHQQPNVPVRREELSGLITKSYKQRYLPSMIINAARRKMLTVFGFDMKEFVRLKSGKAAKSTNAQVELKEYVLESTVPEANLKKYVETPGMAAVQTLTVLVVGIIKYSGGEKVPEETLMQNLQRMGIREDDQEHPVFGNIRTAIDTLSKQRYIQKEKMSGHDGDGFVYELAERALDESFQRRYDAFMSKIVPRDIGPEYT